MVNLQTLTKLDELKLKIKNISDTNKTFESIIDGIKERNIDLLKDITYQGMPIVTDMASLIKILEAMFKNHSDLRMTFESVDSAISSESENIIGIIPVARDIT